MKLTITLLIALMISGCTTTEKQQVIDKISTEVKEVVVDTPKVEPIKEAEVKQEPVIVDDFPLSNLTSNVSVDTPQLANHMTGFQNQSHPWVLMKDLPVTVTIKKFDASGIDLEGVPQGKYTDKGWERTSTFWAFDENGVELGYEDHAYTSYEQPGKFYGKCKYILVVRCSDISAIARSRVEEVK